MKILPSPTLDALRTVSNICPNIVRPPDSAVRIEEGEGGWSLGRLRYYEKRRQSEMNDILDRARRDIARCLYKYGLLQSQPFKTDGPRKGGLWVLLPLAAQIYHVLPYAQGLTVISFREARLPGTRPPPANLGVRL